MSDTNLCPCGSQVQAVECCLPIIEGNKKASTAEELLRARYTAFTKGEVDFILNTHHSRTRHEVNREEISEWSKASQWLGFTLLQSELGKQSDETGTLLFSAQYQTAGKIHDHGEKSFFEKENGEWRFLDAQRIQIGPYRRLEPKTGRNNLCPCGSGKKYKKCCSTKP